MAPADKSELRTTKMDAKRELALVAEIMGAVKADCESRGEDVGASWFNEAARLASAALAVCGVQARCNRIKDDARGGFVRNNVVVILSQEMKDKAVRVGLGGDLQAALGRDSTLGEPMTPKRKAPALPGMATLACAVAYDRSARGVPISKEESEALRKFVYGGPSVWRNSTTTLARVMGTYDGGGAALTSLITTVMRDATSSFPAWNPAEDYALTPFLAACRVQGLDTTLRGEGESDRVVSSVEEALRRRMLWATSVVRHCPEMGDVGGLSLLAEVAAEHRARAGQARP